MKFIKNIIYLFIFAATGNLQLQASTTIFTNNTGYNCQLIYTATSSSGGYAINNGASQSIPNNCTSVTVQPTPTQITNSSATNGIISTNYNGTNNNSTALARTASTGTNWTNNTPFQITLTSGSSSVNLSVGQSTNFTNSGTITIAATTISVPSPGNLPATYSIYLAASTGIVTCGTLTTKQTIKNNAINSQSIANFVFYGAPYNGYQVALSSPVTLGSGATQNMLISATAVTGTYLNSTIISAASYNSSSSSTITTNIFGSGTMTNNTPNTVNVTYTGSVNGQTNLNNPVIAIAPNQAISNILSATGITVTDISGNQIAQQAINPNTSYYINSDGIATTTTPYLYNNYNQATGTVNFYSGVYNSFTLMSSTNISAWGYIAIPTGTTRITFPDLPVGSGSFQIYNTSGITSDITLYTNSIITNLTPYELSLISNPASSFPFGTGTFFINANQSIPIPYNTTSYELVNALGSPTYISSAPIAANTCYEILYDSQSTVNYGYSIISYIPTFTNNYSSDASNLNFYASNGALISSQSTFTAESSATSPGNAYYATSVSLFPSTTVTTPVTYATLTAPITFPAANLFTTDSSNNNYTLTNSSGQAIGVNYYGTINGINNTLLNSSPIQILDTDFIPIITNTSSIQAFIGSSTTPITFTLSTGGTSTQPSLLSGSNYYIFDQSGTWILSTSATLNYSLTNNFNAATGSITFNPEATTISSINSWSLYNDMSGDTTSIIANGLYGDLDADFTIPVTLTGPINLYENYVLMNNTPNTVTVTCYDSGSNLMGTMDMTAGLYLPIVTNTEIFSVSDGINTSVIMQSAPSGSSYIITVDSGALQLASYTPTITNNGSQAGTLTFYNSLPTTNSPALTFNINDPLNVTGNNGNAVYANIAKTDGSFINIPLTYTENENVATDYTLTNNSTETIYITYYGTLNGLADTALNGTSAQVIQAETSIPIPTGATGVSATAGGITVLTETDFTTPNSSYFINDNDDDQWTLTTSIYSATSSLTNTYSTSASVIFLNDGGYQINATAIELGTTSTTNATQIAYGATTAQVVQVLNSISTTLTIPVSDSASSTILSSNVISNQSGNSIYLNFYTALDLGTIMNTPMIEIANQSSFAIIYGAQYVSVYDSSTATTPVYTQAYLAASTTYYVTDINGVWNVSSTAPNIYSLYNNYDATANTVTFYDSSGDAQGSTSINGNSSAQIPTSSVTYTTITSEIISDTLGNDTTISIVELPLSTTANTNIFSTGNLTNNSGQDLTINYYQVNGFTTNLLNTTPITVGIGGNIPIIFGNLTSVVLYIYTATSSPNPQFTTTIYPNINYYINSSNSLISVTTSPTLYTLTNNNNSAQTATEIIFLNSSGDQQGGPYSAVAGGNAPIAMTATTSATLTETIVDSFSTPTTTNITIPVNNTQNSNIFGPNNTTITNDSSQSVTITYSGLVNGSMTDFNTTMITVAIGASIPIICGNLAISNTENVTMTVNGSTSTTTLINPNNSYFINADLTPTIDVTNYFVTNNYTQPISPATTSLQFYNASSPVGSAILLSGSGSTNSIATIPSSPVTSAVLTDDTIIDSLGTSTTTNITIPVLQAQNSNIFGPNTTVTNSSSTQTIYVTYSGLINASTTDFNGTEITVAIGASIPIICGNLAISDTANVTMTVSNGATSTITLINPNNSYFINSDLIPTIDETNYFLTNNYGQSTTTNLQFYNGSDVPQGSAVAVAAQETATIPATVVAYATLAENIYDTSTTFTTTSMTIPVINGQNSTIFGTGTITNTSSSTVNVTYTATNLTTSTITLRSGGTIPIVSGNLALSDTANVTIACGGTTIPSTLINPNTNYYIYYDSGIWYFTDYNTPTTVTNNYSQNATNLDFFDTTSTLLASYPTFNNNTSVPMPTPTTYVTLDDTFNSLASALTIYVNGSANANIFTTNIISNNASLVANLTFNNDSELVPALNDPTIKLTAAGSTGSSVNILTGTTSIYLQQNSTTYPITSGLSYYVNYENGIWSINEYTYSSLLTNNSNTQGTSLIFYNTSNTATSISASINANGYAPIPTTSTWANLNYVFNSPSNTTSTNINIPVSDSTSSNIFFANSSGVSYTITNTSTETIELTFYGTINELDDQSFNQAPIQLTATGTSEQSIPILMNAQYVIVTYNNVEVLNTSSEIPQFDTSYDITFANNTWSIIPATLNLSNNCKEAVTLLTYYDSSGNEIPAPGSYTSITPWGMVPMPVGAVSVKIEYSLATITVVLDPNYSTSIFTNSLLINNSDIPVLVTIYNGNTLLNTTNIPLQAGQSIPFIYGTNSINITTLDDRPITTSYPIVTNTTYTIGLTNNYDITPVRSVQTRDASGSVSTTSSNLGIIRFLGGSTPVAPKMANVNLYAQNPDLYAQFLYVTSYAQYITDAQARQATIDAVNVILINFGNAYRNQSGFNYISYFYLINEQLTAAQTLLKNQYYNSSIQIDAFFTALQNRVNRLLN